MKKIKIAHLTNVSDLKLNVITQKNITLESPEKAKEVLEKINALIAEFRTKGMEIIIGQSIEDAVAVSTKVELKNNKSYFLPEPNPVHLFFTNAVQHFENAKQLKQELDKIEHTNYHQLFLSFNIFFNEVTTGVIMLYTSVEAFINQHIPEKYAFDIDGKIFLKKDIEWMDIKEKIKDYLPIVFGGLKFQISNDKQYQKILKIREIRNNLIHLKTELSINKTFYEALFTELIEAKTDDFVEAVFVFMNTFRPGYLVEETNGTA